MKVQPLARTGLAALLDAATGTQSERIDRALTVLLDELGMQVAYVSLLRDGRRVVRHSVSVPGGPVLPVGTTHPQRETLCHLVASGLLEPLIPDAADHGLLATHPHTAAFGIRSHAGVPLVLDGQVRGAVCCAAGTANDALDSRDETTLRTVAAHIAGLLTTAERSAPVPDVRRLAEAVTGGDSLETLTRPLLQLMQEVTGLETTYLSLLDPSTDELVVAYAQNSGELTVAEGTAVRWADSICRRCLTENRPAVVDVPATWPDCVVAGDLGVRTYVSVPVRDEHDHIVGTLCAAGQASTGIDERDVAVMTTFAALLAAQLTREAAHTTRAARLAALEHRLSSLRDTADRDPLTGLANRAGIHRWLQAAVDRLADGTTHLAVAFIDLDSFKGINDRYGHGVGDDVLRAMAASLARIGRAGDLHGRLGGDEFVAAALLPTESAIDNWHDRLRGAATVSARGVQVTATIGVTTATRMQPTVEELLDRADQQMYRAKRHADRAGR